MNFKRDTITSRSNIGSAPKGDFPLVFSQLALITTIQSCGILLLATTGDRKCQPTHSIP